MPARKTVFTGQADKQHREVLKYETQKC